MLYVELLLGIFLSRTKISPDAIINSIRNLQLENGMTSENIDLLINIFTPKTVATEVSLFPLLELT